MLLLTLTANKSLLKTTTFLESSGREPSHGDTLDMDANTKNSSNLPVSHVDEGEGGVEGGHEYV